VGDDGEGVRLVNVLETVQFALGETVLTYNRLCKEARDDNDLKLYEARRIVLDDLFAAREALKETT